MHKALEAQKIFFKNFSTVFFQDSACYRTLAVSKNGITKARFIERPLLYRVKAGLDCGTHDALALYFLSVAVAPKRADGAHTLCFVAHDVTSGASANCGGT